MLSERINNYYTDIMLDPSKFRKILRISMALHIFASVHETEDCLYSLNLRVFLQKLNNFHRNYVVNQLTDCFGGAISKF
jgi:hypothetical protein